ncbi:MAG: Unknown protein [uncultured Aureispira sp.]|uniref:Uncharacterized protein n=1 Tax=uncultured Aureispira sp. TaxID=1331704 RepID=A0A6S6RTJ2_9BACT|nr:MAG: Unknown protein [uncultured Aureispira sp.]
MPQALYSWAIANYLSLFRLHSIKKKKKLLFLSKKRKKKALFPKKKKKVGKKTSSWERVGKPSAQLLGKNYL